jgi:hypothetical protein
VAKTGERLRLLAVLAAASFFVCLACESVQKPSLATAVTRADPHALAALQKPGKVFFEHQTSPRRIPSSRIWAHLFL